MPSGCIPAFSITRREASFSEIRQRDDPLQPELLVPDLEHGSQRLGRVPASPSVAPEDVGRLDVWTDTLDHGQPGYTDEWVALSLVQRPE